MDPMTFFDWKSFDQGQLHTIAADKPSATTSPSTRDGKGGKHKAEELKLEEPKAEESIQESESAPVVKEDDWFTPCGKSVSRRDARRRHVLESDCLNVKCVEALAELVAGGKIKNMRDAVANLTRKQSTISLGYSMFPGTVVDSSAVPQNVGPQRGIGPAQVEGWDAPLGWPQQQYQMMHQQHQIAHPYYTVFRLNSYGQQQRAGYAGPITYISGDFYAHG